MLAFDTPGDLQMALVAFLVAHSADIPAPTRDALVQAQAQPAMYQRFVQSLEALFAAGDAAGTAGLATGKALAQFAAVTFGPLAGPDGIGEPGRAQGQARAFMRRLGELTADEAPPEADPAFLPAFMAA